MKYQCNNCCYWKRCQVYEEENQMGKINSLNGFLSMLVTEVGNSLCRWQVCDVRTKHCHQHKFPTHSLSSLKVVKGVDINMNQIDGITKFSDKVPNVKRKSPFYWRTIPKFCSKENPSKTQRPSHSESGHVKWWKVLCRWSKI